MANPRHLATFAPMSVLPLLALAVDMLLKYSGMFHPSTQTQITLFGLVMAIAPLLSLYIHQVMDANGVPAIPVPAVPPVPVPNPPAAVPSPAPLHPTPTVEPPTAG